MKTIFGAVLALGALSATCISAPAATLDDVMARLESMQRDNQAIRRDNEAMRKELSALRKNEQRSPRQVAVSESAPSRQLSPAAGSAMAADYPTKAPMYSPVAYTHNWTGIYVGGHVGYGSSTKDWNLVNLGGVPIAGGILLGSGDIGGGLGGVQAGLNYQIGNIVLGVEGDYSWADLSGQTCNILFGGNFVCNSQVNAISTLTGRFGVAVDRILVYAKGGVAWIKDTDKLQTTLGGNTSTGIADDQTKRGLTAGAGVEYALTPNWSAKLEYDFVNFKDEGITALPLGAFGAVTADIKQQIHMIKFGINYKFDWASAR